MSVHASRRWLRFSLRTLLVLVTVFCVWLGWQVRIVQARKAAIMDIGSAGGHVWMTGDAAQRRSTALPFWRYWMGDEPVRTVEIREGNALKIGLERMDEIRAVIPKADIDHIVAFTGQGPTMPYSKWRAQQHVP